LSDLSDAILALFAFGIPAKKLHPILELLVLLFDFSFGKFERGTAQEVNLKLPNQVNVLKKSSV